MNAQDAVAEIRQRFAGGRERLFVLHGNTNDIVPSVNADGTVELCSLAEYVQRSMPNVAGGQQRIWAHFSPAFGLRWLRGSEVNAEARIGKLAGNGLGNPELYRAPIEFFRLIDRVCARKERPEGARDASGDQFVPLRVILTEAGFVVPSVPQTSFLRPEHIEAITLLKRFATEREYDGVNTMVVLVTEAITDIHPALREVSVAIEVFRPNEQEIAAYVDEAIARSGVRVADGAHAQVRKLAVGLTRRQVENTVVEHVAADKPIEAKGFALRRKSLISRDYGDLLEFIEPNWTLDDVGGAFEAVAELRALAEAIKRGDADIPSGLIAAGQNGVGKTHLFKGFAGTLGIPYVGLKAFKTADYGGSERQWAKIATALTSAGQIVAGIEEADGVIGSRTGPNVHEVSKAILSAQLALIGDPKYRGKIIWLLDTCRPDKLAPDVKRPGRCERVIALFPETTPEGVRAVIRAQVGLLTRERGYRFADGFVEGASDDIVQLLVGKSGSQVKQALERTKKKVANGEPISVEHLRTFFASNQKFRAEPEAYLLQRLIAIAEAIETENADLIPEFYRKEVEEKYAGIAGVKETIEILRRRIDGV